jgi:hypothetical protein
MLEALLPERRAACTSLPQIHSYLLAEIFFAHGLSG